MKLKKWVPAVLTTLGSLSIIVGVAAGATIIKNSVDIAGMKETIKAAEERDTMIIEQIKAADKRAEKRIDKLNNRFDFVYDKMNRIKEIVEK